MDPISGYSCKSKLPTLLCNKCQFKTHFTLSYNQHINSTHTNRTKPKVKRYTCRNCPFQTFSLLVLLKHRKNSCLEYEKGYTKVRIKGESRYKCKWCDRLSRNKANWEKHKRAKHAGFGKLLHCKRCFYSTVYKDSLEKHVERQHTPKHRVKRQSNANFHTICLFKGNDKTQVVHKCESCSYFTNSLVCITNHVRRHQQGYQPFDCQRTTIEPFSCIACPFLTTFLLHYNQHCKKQKENSLKVKQYSCRNCTFQTHSRFLWFKHSAKICPVQESSERRLQCKDCGFKCKDKKTLKIHVNHRHAPLEKVKWYECDQCEFKGRHPSHLVLHVRKEHTRVFSCHFCEYTATQKTFLNRHLISKHTPIEDIVWLPCDKCEYRAKTRYNLSRHVRRSHVIGDAESYHCDYCSFTTTRKSNLNRHTISKHTPDDDIKWLQCDQCDFRAKFKDRLMNHVNCKHAKEDDIKWALCELCGHRAKSRRFLATHMYQRHNTDVKWHECEHCEYKVKRLKDLKRHVIDVHTPVEEIKWIQCVSCDFRTPHDDKLRKHVRKHHSAVSIK